MTELSGSKTEKNLQEAFAGESQARNKYTAFASVARKEGYEQIAAIFLETADQEKTHAKLHLQLLTGIGNTLENLKAAAHGENCEWTDMYPRMAREAKEEGFGDIAMLFENLAKIEKEHEARYTALAKNLQAGTVFAKPQKTRWRCRECGFTHEGTQALKTCPVCKHPQAFQEVAAENF